MTLVSFVAALFDVIKNLNLILILFAPDNFPTVSSFLTSLFAILKFSLILTIIVFWIGIAVWLLYYRASCQTE